MNQDELKNHCGWVAYNNAQSNELFNMYNNYLDEYNIECTGDVCVGDEIVFVEACFVGGWKKPKFSHFEIIQGEIINDSYGADKQQHTFTILKKNGEKICRKGRNVYRYLTLRKNRDDFERSKSLNEKHERGLTARSQRDARKYNELNEAV